MLLLLRKDVDEHATAAVANQQYRFLNDEKQTLELDVKLRNRHHLNGNGAAEPGIRK